MTLPRSDGFVFLSHNSQDKPSVEALAYALLDAGIEPWLDKWNLVPGLPWQRGITDALRDADAIVVCVGANGLGHVQSPEVEVALDQAWRDPRRPVIPVLLPGAVERPELPDFLRMRTWVDLRQGLTGAGVRAVAEATVGRATGPRPSADLPPPYPGLPPYDESDAPRFFGREGDVAALLARLRAGQRLLTLVGASGSGKSSLVRAGLIPAIRTGQLDGSYDWRVLLLRPGPRPLHELSVRMVQVEGGDTSTLDALKEALVRRASTLSDRVDLLLAGSPSRLLLVVDQFEEAFTQTEDADDRRAFIENLLHAATVAGGRATVVLTLRADFLGRALDHSRALAEAVKTSQELVLPMAPDQLRAAIERPALQARLRFDDGLVNTLAEAVAGQPGDLPLLQFTLRELWLRREGTRLTWAAYTAIGGVRGAIAARAEAFLAAPDLDDRTRRELRRVLVRLVEVRERTGDTRRRASRAELESLGSAAIRPVLNDLIDERLLTATEEGVEVAHEALIREWKTLREWVNADREFLLWRERFRGLLAEWQRRDKDPGALLPPALLAEAERWLAERPDELGAADHEYIGAGVAHREDARRVEVERQRVEQERRDRDIRRQSVSKTLAVAMGVVVLSAIGTLGVSAFRREFIRSELVRGLASDREWVGIPAPSGGQFRMGCVPADKLCSSNERSPDEPKNPRPLTGLSQRFEMMRHEVTVARFRRFIDAQSMIVGRLLQPDSSSMEAQPRWSGDNHPVVNVSWNNAREFCAFVRGRLPTEAEWEYAARGGNADAIYPWGDEFSPDRANGAGVAGKDTWEQSAPVGSFPKNDYELHDMIGNVWEWTESVNFTNPFRGGDGSKGADPASRQARMVRGGSWADDPQGLRVSLRSGYGGRGSDLGFRCARDGSP